MKLFRRCCRAALAAISCLLVSQAFATSAPSRPIAVLYLCGILNSSADGESSRFALELAIQQSPQYPQYASRLMPGDTLVSAVSNYGMTPIDVQVSKIDEEHYLWTLEKAFQQGSRAPKVTSTGPFASVYKQYLPKETALFQTGVENTINWLTTLIDGGMDVVLVAHSEGTLQANFALSGLLAKFGTRSGLHYLDHIRVVDVASVARFTPNNFVVSLDSDQALDDAQSAGLAAERSTPYCRGGVRSRSGPERSQQRRKSARTCFATTSKTCTCRHF